MGQYYNILYKPEIGKTEIYQPKIPDITAGVKLMEHSWINNPVMNAISRKLYEKPARVAWVGDYSKNEQIVIEKKLYNKAWKENAAVQRLYPSAFQLNGCYIINRSKKEYVDYNAYIKRCKAFKKFNGIKSEWIIHPLSLLTAVGNGQGEGDYKGYNAIGENIVGKWCYDLITIKDTKPAKGYKELECIFEEK